MGPYGETMGEGVDAKRIGRALDVAWKFGAEDGDHHKMWVIDQMVRALLGCPEVTLRSRFPDVNGNHYEYASGGPGMPSGACSSGLTPSGVQLTESAVAYASAPPSFTWGPDAR